MNGIKPIDLRWSDLDPVGHMKHSVYYDLAASQRIGMLHEVGLGIQELAAMGLWSGPVQGGLHISARDPIIGPSTYQSTVDGSFK